MKTGNCPSFHFDELWDSLIEADCDSTASAVIVAMVCWYSRDYANSLQLLKKAEKELSPQFQKQSPIVDEKKLGLRWFLKERYVEAKTLGFCLR